MFYVLERILNRFKKPGYNIDDPRPRQKEAPYTFFLPLQKELDALEVGDVVKLTFEGTGRDADYIERMWVIIQSLDGDNVTGTLDNAPYNLRAISLGDELRFKRSDIITLHEYRFEDDRPIANDAFFYRCYADPELIYGDEKPHLIYRETPIEVDDDNFPDVGWRFCGPSTASQDSALNMDEAQRIAIGVLLNKDDSYIDLLRSEIGARYFRASPKEAFSHVP